jgi:biotin carboxyl carrier protein
MPDELRRLALGQDKPTDPLKPADSIPGNGHGAPLAAGRRTADIPLIAKKMEHAVKLFAEVSEYLEKKAPQHKRVLDEARMRISDVDMLLQQTSDEEISGVHRIVAPMPGVITRCNKGIGQEVRQGEVVLVLDAMKMENLITAPVAGKIVALPYREGQKVPKGSVLAIIGLKHDSNWDISGRRSEER